MGDILIKKGDIGQFLNGMVKLFHFHKFLIRFELPLRPSFDIHINGCSEMTITVNCRAVQ